MKIRQTIVASVIALTAMGMGAAHAANFIDDGAFTVTVHAGQETTSYAGASTFANGSTLAGYSGSLAIPGIATITGGSPNGNTPPDSGLATPISNWISAGTGGTETITFNSIQRYFGLLWGSVDVGNTVDLYNGALLVGHYTGGALEASSPGLLPYSNPGSFVDFAADGGGYYFNKVVLSGSDLPFETVNYASLAAVPEPATWAMLLLGMFGAGYMVRGARRKDAAVTA